MKIPVLKIKDKNGNFIPINAIRGEKGKSAYEQAKDGGFNGTEEEFIATLFGAISHYSNSNNPHKVTAKQVGALPITGGDLQGSLGLVGEGDANASEIGQNSDYATIIRNKADGIETILALTNETKVDMADVLKLWFANGKGCSIYGEHYKPTASDVGAIPEAYYASDDLDTELQQGGSKMKVCSYHSGTLNTPYAEGLTVFAHGMVITNAYDLNYGTQLCMPSGEDSIYVRRLNGGGISKWVKMADNKRVTPIELGGTGATTAKEAREKLGATKIIKGTYTGDGKETQFINLGETPKAVFSANYGWMITVPTDNYGVYGGLAIQGSPVKKNTVTIIEIVDNGFNAYYASLGSDVAGGNVGGGIYNYIAFF